MVQFNMINKLTKLVLLILILDFSLLNFAYANDSFGIDYENLIVQEEQKISELKQDAEVKEKNCYKRFFINSCIDKVKKNLYKQTDVLEAKVLEYKQANRRKIFDAGQAKIANANKQFEIEAKARTEKEQKNISDFEHKQNQDKSRNLQNIAN